MLPWAALAACDVLLAWMNYQATDDVQLVAAGLIACGFGFAYWRPRLAPLTVPLLWLSIPVSSLLFGSHSRDHAPLYETLIALVFPVLGAVLGAGARALSRSA